MEKTCLQIAKFFGLSTSVIYPMLCRPEFEKYRYRKTNNINLDFIEELNKFFEKKKFDRVASFEKFQNAQKKLQQWKRQIS